MPRRLKFTPTANQQLTALEGDSARTSVCRQVKKTLGFLELNPRHPGLHSHEFVSLVGANGEKIFEAYAQNNTPGAYRVFWHYGPDEVSEKKRVSVLTIVAITPHP